MKLNYFARRKNEESKIEITGNKTSQNFGLMVKNQYSDSWLIQFRTRGKTRGIRWNSKTKLNHGTRYFVWQKFGVIWTCSFKKFPQDPKEKKSNSTTIRQT